MELLSWVVPLIALVLVVVLVLCFRKAVERTLTRHETAIGRAHLRLNRMRADCENKEHQRYQYLYQEDFCKTCANCGQVLEVYKNKAEMLSKLADRLSAEGRYAESDAANTLRRRYERRGKKVVS